VSMFVCVCVCVCVCRCVCLCVCTHVVLGVFVCLRVYEFCVCLSLVYDANVYVV